MTWSEGQCRMANRESRKSKKEARAKQRESRITDENAFPSQRERLPPHIPGGCNVAMGLGEEIVAWLRVVPGNTPAILISFPNEASFRIYGPIFWHVVHELPEIVQRIGRRRFEQLVDALTLL